MKNKTMVYYGKYSLQHWIHLILRKNILLPDYQRIFVWNEKEVTELMETFKNNQFVPPVTIGLFSEPSGNKNYIIDGQQRLTAILLAYLGIFPNKEKFAKHIESNENEHDEDGNLVENQDYIEWRFDRLVSEATNKSKFLEKLDDNFYDKGIDYGIPEYNENDSKNNKFFKENFLAFSFIVPESQNETQQKKFYATVFKNINSKGRKLNDVSSREGFYYLDKEKQMLFKPEFIKKYKVGNQNIDFIRYLSLLSQYHQNHNEKELAKGYSGRMEDYYISYLDETLGEKEHGVFAKYEEVFKDGYSDHLNRLENTMGQLDLHNMKFSSYVEADYYFFGLIYMILFKNKSIDINRKENLKNDLNTAYKNNTIKGINANTFTYLRPRIANSIKIYSGYAHD